MTKEEIMEMKPGPEFDILITEMVMGWKRIAPVSWWKCGATFALKNAFGTIKCPKCQISSYSQDIEAAWEVVEKMMSKEYRYVLKGNFRGNGKHWCGFDNQEWVDHNPLFQSPLCDTLPLAICKAALIAITQDKGEENYGQ